MGTKLFSVFIVTIWLLGAGLVWAGSSHPSADPPGQHHAISCLCGCKLPPPSPKPKDLPCYRSGCGDARGATLSSPSPGSWFLGTFSAQPEYFPLSQGVRQARPCWKAYFPPSLDHPPPFPA
jgi:hypothetical protein